MNFKEKQKQTEVETEYTEDFLDDFHDAVIRETRKQYKDYIGYMQPFIPAYGYQHSPFETILTKEDIHLTPDAEDDSKAIIGYCILRRTRKWD